MAAGLASSDQTKNVPGQRLTGLNNIDVATVLETLIDAHGPFNHGWRENVFKRVGHIR